MLIGDGQEWLEGEEQAWQELAELNPEDVCHRSKAEWNAAESSYVLPVFGDYLFIAPEKRTIRGNSLISDILLNELPHYSRIPALHYLVNARDISPTGNLINPREVDGGQIFTQGTYMLPLERITENYGSGTEDFLEKGRALNGETIEYGDASLRLFPFPRVPVILILWQDDPEFPARAEVLFDETCSRHLPTSVLWATAMMTILIMTHKTITNR
jgi:hypothetical protein